MRFDFLPREPVAGDRRVQRSRANLKAAAVRLVSERGTTDLPVAEIAEIADVSRQLVYTQFGDRDSLLIAAALDLIQRELVPAVESGTELQRSASLALATHFAGHRPFYRAMLTGSCARAMSIALSTVLGSFNRRAVDLLFGQLEETTAQDMALFLTGGAAALVDRWLVDGEDPLDPEELADRLLHIVSVLATGHHR